MRYEYIEGTSSKFWEIELSGKTVTTTYGRIGSAGQSTEKIAATPAAAKVLHDKLVAEKLAKGYRLARAARSVAKKVAAPAAKATAAKATAAKATAAKATAAKPAAKTTPKTAAKRSAKALTAKAQAKKLPAAKTATKAPTTKAPAQGKSDGLGATLKAIDAALSTYAPTLKSRMRPASGFAELEKILAIPAPLRALWSWCDGCGELLRSPASGAALDLLSVHQAAETMAEIQDASEDDDDASELAGIPFATESGSGDYLVLDEAGAVRYWDHEEGRAERRPIAKSLDALLALTLDAIRKNQLFGGREGSPGEPDPRVKRLDSLLKNPEKNFDRIMDGTYRVFKNPIAPADCYRIRRGLEGAAQKLSATERDAYYTRLAGSAIEAGALEEANEYLEKAGVGKRTKDTNDWRILGEAALEASAFDLAAKAFARDTVVTRGYASLSPVGAALALWKLGRDTTASVAAAKKALAKDLAQADLSTQVLVRTNHAVIARIEGDQAAVAQWIEKARDALREYKADGGGMALASPEELDFARLAGLSASTPPR